MKSFFVIAWIILLIPQAYSQDLLPYYRPDQIMTPENCYDIVKLIWEGLKTYADEFEAVKHSKSEFESTVQFQTRLDKAKEHYIGKIKSFISDNKLDTRIFAVILNAHLNKYDADNGTYLITSPTRVLISPSKDHIKLAFPENKFVSTFERSENGYRRAFFTLKDRPGFTWYVNAETAKKAKSHEQSLFFRLWFKFDVDYSNAAQRIYIQLVPKKIGLVDQQSNTTFWSEDIQ